MNGIHNGVCARRQRRYTALDGMESIDFFWGGNMLGKISNSILLDSARKWAVALASLAASSAFATPTPYVAVFTPTQNPHAPFSGGGTDLFPAYEVKGGGYVIVSDKPDASATTESEAIRDDAKTALQLHFTHFPEPDNPQVAYTLRVFNSEAYDDSEALTLKLYPFSDIAGDVTYFADNATYFADLFISLPGDAHWEIVSPNNDCLLYFGSKPSKCFASNFFSFQLKPNTRHGLPMQNCAITVEGSENKVCVANQDLLVHLPSVPRSSTPPASGA